MSLAILRFGKVDLTNTVSPWEPKSRLLQPLRVPTACKHSYSVPKKRDVDSWVVHSGSRPMSPEQQMDVMLQEEMEIESKEKKPSELDLEVLSYCGPRLER